MSDIGHVMKNKGIIKINKHRTEATKKSARVQIQKDFNLLQQNGLIPADLKTQDSKTVKVFCNKLYKNYLKDNNTMNNRFMDKIAHISSFPGHLLKGY